MNGNIYRPAMHMAVMASSLMAKLLKMVAMLEEVIMAIYSVW